MWKVQGVGELLQATVEAKEMRGSSKDTRTQRGSITDIYVYDTYVTTFSKIYIMLFWRRIKTIA